MVSMSGLPTACGMSCSGFTNQIAARCRGYAMLCAPFVARVFSYAP
jgi:hypothetical protein